MPKFQNSYSVQKIVYKQKCRCFCPIGKADYTNEFTVIIEPVSYTHLDVYKRQVQAQEGNVRSASSQKAWR